LRTRTILGLDFKVETVISKKKTVFIQPFEKTHEKGALSVSLLTEANRHGHPISTTLSSSQGEVSRNHQDFAVTRSRSPQRSICSIGGAKH
jgi:hypothetical protein